MLLCGPLWSFAVLCGPLRYLVIPALITFKYSLRTPEIVKFFRNVGFIVEVCKQAQCVEFSDYIAVSPYLWQTACSCLFVSRGNAKLYQFGLVYF